MPRRRKSTVAKSNLPNYILKIGATNTKGKAAWNRVGAAWLTDDNAIAIRLDAGTVLDWHDFSRIIDEKDCALMLFPNEE